MELKELEMLIMIMRDHDVAQVNLGDTIVVLNPKTPVTAELPYEPVKKQEVTNPLEDPELWPGGRVPEFDS